MLVILSPDKAIRHFENTTRQHLSKTTRGDHVCQVAQYKGGDNG